VAFGPVIEGLMLIINFTPSFPEYLMLFI
jgi:hypothetical protein